jgi:hypothetical protein
LVEEEVEFVVIGGFAAVALGVPYITRDIDLCYNPEPVNIARLERALAPLHPRIREHGLTHEEAGKLSFRLDERTLQQTTMLALQTDAAELDLISTVLGVGNYMQVRNAAITIEAFGFQLLVLDLPALIASKRATGRTKDLLLLPQIEAIFRFREEDK